MDASKLVSLLKKESKKLEIKHINSNVIRIERNSNGIDYLLIENEDKISADIYIDATGFKRLLMDPNQNYINFEFLPCNAAVASSTSHKNKEITPCTRAIAHNAGWIWDIPLYSRRGIGCVYSKEHMNKSEAIKSLERTLQINIDSNKTKFIEFEAGFLEKPWHKNVIFIGLSAGFVEPLRKCFEVFRR